MVAMLSKLIRQALPCACLLFLFVSTVHSDTRPLPEDLGALHLAQLLTRLKTTARIMQVVAHPDDEDGGLLTLEARGNGVSVLLFTVTRGEGGQNKFGAESSDELGILRTLELLEADKYYGVEQRFSHVVDFGFSKTAEETFNKWHGHDVALADLVRAIRIFRPDVLTSRFSGTPRDGHGHHQASAILTAEAFRAAADPNKFPEQIKEGLLPWQAKKLYLGNPPRMFLGGNVSDEDYTVKLNIGEYSPLLGMSYTQFALEGLAHQTSQGTGGIRVPPGPRYTYYKLTDSTLPKPASHEADFFDGIDTSLVGLAARLGAEETKVPFLRPALESLQKHVDEANKVFSLQDSSACAPELLAGRDEAEKLVHQVEDSRLPAPARAELLTALRDKFEQFQQAANESLGIFFEITVDPPGPPPDPSYFPRMEQTLSLAVPGQSFTVTTRLYNRGKATVIPQGVFVEAADGWKIEHLTSPSNPYVPLKAGDVSSDQFKLTVLDDAKYTKPYFTRGNPETETIYSISDTKYLTLPWSPYPVRAFARFAMNHVNSEASGVAKIKFIDPTLGQSERPLAVGPPISVLLTSPVAVAAVGGAGKSQIGVSVRSNVQSAVHAKLKLDTPQGWKVEPAEIAVDLDHDGDVNNYSFHVTPQNLHEGTYKVTARAEYNGKQYAEGFKVITRPDLDSYYAYRPATENVQAVDVKLPTQLRVGYIMGAGDEIPSVLQSVGLNTSIVTPQELASGDLSRYGTIIVGIRAYDTRTDVREHNRRLLDYVNGGGTLIVQYNQSIGAFNDGHYTPYPATAANVRVSVEEQPVEVLAPEERVFNWPNKITQKDFDGWVQERGLYFMSQWDPQFKPLLACNDPGEPPQKGGLLLAHYGKGIYIFSAYGFSRQLPAGVPGAIRLFVNLVSAGHQ
ncbi:MAG TPA: PIG-L family deacetylase [Candidatus Dormibacteraeota bacterium]|nr:PIG-L family deacetylase [Candidatus Dormibacteraeota bacterium]